MKPTTTNLFAVGLCSFTLALSQTVLSDQDHFATTQYDGSQVITTEHFKFPSHTLSFKAPPNWLPFYDQGSTSEPFIKYLNRAGDCTIEIRQLSAPASLTDEKSALTYYEGRIKEFPTPNFVKDARVRDVNNPEFFPQTYLLATDEKSPPRKMVTYIFKSPYLYEIVLDLQAGHLKGNFRTDYGNICQSIQFESNSEAPATTAANNPEATAGTAATSPTENQSTQPTPANTATQTP